MERVEEFCVSCDVSSNEVSGTYYDNAWYCYKCGDNSLEPLPVRKETVKRFFDTLIKQLDDE